MERHRAARGLTPSEVARVFRDEGLPRAVIDNYYLYHIESPDNMVADPDSYRRSGRPADAPPR